MNTHQYSEDDKQRIRLMVEAFEGCRKYVEQSVRDGGGLCMALVNWEIEGAVPWGARAKAASDAGSLIRRALNGHVFLEYWRRHRNLPYKSLATRIRMRHMWLDKLIADCKAALEDVP